MLNNQEQAFILTITRSIRLAHIVYALHLLALAAILICTLFIGIKIAIFFLCCLNVCYFIKSSKEANYTLKYTKSIGWEILERDNFVPIRIENSTVVSRFAVFLHFRQQNSSEKAIIILNDSIDADNFRRLMVNLKTSTYSPR